MKNKSPFHLLKSFDSNMLKYILIIILLFGQSLFSQTKIGIMVNSHVSSFENFNEGNFQEYSKFYLFLNPTFLVNFGSENYAISLRPGYYYSNSVKGFQLGGYYMRNLYSDFYAIAGFNFLFSSESTIGNSINENIYSKTFTYGVLGFGYSYKKLLIELNYGINFSDSVYGKVIYEESNLQITKEVKLNNIFTIGFGVVL